jgi:alpha-glucosidase
MRNVPIPPDRVQDPFEKNVPGLGLGRDPSRTPMPWTADKNAGFTSGEPWLPLADDFQTVNVTSRSADARSILQLYRRLIDVRRSEPALSLGRYTAVPADGNLLAYRRSHAHGREFLVILNFGAEPQLFAHKSARGALRISTHLDRSHDVYRGEIKLRGDEGLLIELEGS